jgi:hypothetical protein
MEPDLANEKKVVFIDMDNTDEYRLVGSRKELRLFAEDILATVNSDEPSNAKLKSCVVLFDSGLTQIDVSEVSGEIYFEELKGERRKNDLKRKGALTIFFLILAGICIIVGAITIIGFVIDFVN